MSKHTEMTMAFKAAQQEFSLDPLCLLLVDVPNFRIRTATTHIAN